MRQRAVAVISSEILAAEVGLKLQMIRPDRGGTLERRDRLIILRAADDIRPPERVIQLKTLRIERDRLFKEIDRRKPPPALQRVDGLGVERHRFQRRPG